MTGPLILAYDGSEDAAHAIKCAGRLLAPGRALVVHSYAGELDAVEGGERLAAEGVRLALAAGFQAQPIVVKQDGRVWPVLIACAEKHRAAAIVTGARGHSAFASVVLGSTSHGLLHHSHVPVLVVSASAAREGHEGPELLCSDGSDNAKRAIEVAAGLVASKHALVLHVWQDWLEHTPRHLPIVGGAAVGMARELDAIASAQASEQALNGAALARELGFEAEPLSRGGEGPIWRVILESAAETDARMIVIASHGLSGAGALGSVSNGVVYHAKRPVLVVPPPEVPLGLTEAPGRNAPELIARSDVELGEDLAEVVLDGTRADE